MVQNATVKEVKDGYAIVSHDGHRLLLLSKDKADMLLMTPVESLLVLVPHHLGMPYAGAAAGLSGPSWNPVKGQKELTDQATMGPPLSHDGGTPFCMRSVLPSRPIGLAGTVHDVFKTSSSLVRSFLREMMRI